MKTTIIKFIIELFQKIIASITGNIISHYIIKFIKCILLILLLLIISFIIIQYFGIYDIIGLIKEMYPRIDILINNFHKFIK